jgi:hypothetical protein
MNAEHAELAGTAQPVVLGVFGVLGDLGDLSI